VNVLIEKNVPMTVRDGTTLRADLYRPADDGRYPVLIQRTPYNKDYAPIASVMLDPVRAATAGYVVMVQDVRARWSSDGDKFFMFRNEAEDGHDTFAWAIEQPWCDGTAAGYGLSYTGGTAWLSAAEQAPGLKAISALQAPNDTWRQLWPGGTFGVGLLAFWALYAIAPSAVLRARMGTPQMFTDMLRLVDDIDAYDAQVRHLPIREMPGARPDDPELLEFFFEVMRHPTPDDFNRTLGMSGRHPSITVPALIIGGWHDIALDSDLSHFTTMREQAGTEEAREKTRIVIGPWSHGVYFNTVGDLDFGFRSSGMFLDLREDLTALQLRWFDHWTKGKRTGVENEAPVKLFVQGVNRWRDEHDWPLTRAVPTDWFLHGDGGLSPEAPGVDGASRSYVYDPADPCPTTGGRLLLPGTYRPGPVDQTPVMERRDVLTYTSEPLQKDLEVIGPVSAVLYASTSGPDTDWVVKLCDVHPDGRTFNVTDGVLRARYRNSATDPTLVEPFAVERYEVDMVATAIVFQAGHRIRVLVTSSDFPRYDRNLNTGQLGIDSAEMRPALQTIFSDGQRGSHVVLPVTAGGPRPEPATVTPAATSATPPQAADAPPTQVPADAGTSPPDAPAPPVASAGTGGPAQE
jgi:uncharacterized protein